MCGTKTCEIAKSGALYIISNVFKVLNAPPAGGAPGAGALFAEMDRRRPEPDETVTTTGLRFISMQGKLTLVNSKLSLDWEPFETHCLSERPEIVTT
jgi:hypothetical protein